MLTTKSFTIAALTKLLIKALLSVNDQSLSKSRKSVTLIGDGFHIDKFNPSFICHSASYILAMSLSR